ncbi:hypothetical protein EDB92DRAFT_2102142 [Lactarius akahatsu]|uniref:Uncharacterized protein n=1 Tax=Lactarius akahatsu TaxID=416441 RepID=A0AAD4LQW0_9AGAM|nr:hypothetical protein EDB92DRAFT_2102142 [Lactarius akahatsu]
MAKLTKRTLQAQVEVAICPALAQCTLKTLVTPQNIDRENSNKVKQEESVLSIARIKTQARTAEADAEAYSSVAEHTRLEVEAEAHATRFAVGAAAKGACGCGGHG